MSNPPQTTKADGFCIRARNGKFLISTFAKTATGSIKKYCLFGWGWPKALEDGYRCVPIVILEAKP